MFLISINPDKRHLIILPFYHHLSCCFAVFVWKSIHFFYEIVIWCMLHYFLCFLHLYSRQYSVDWLIMKISLQKISLSLSLSLCPHYPHCFDLFLPIKGEAARVWCSIGGWEEQCSPPSYFGYTGRPGWPGHPGHLQHTRHCAPHLPAWLHPHIAPLTWRCPPHDLSDPRVPACDPGVSPCYPCNAHDPHDAWISGGDEDGAPAPGIHTPQPI